MYLDKPINLFEDLSNIFCLRQKMVNVREKFQAEDVEILMNIVTSTMLQLNDKTLSWHPDNAQNMQQYNLFKEDVKKLLAIDKKLQKELKTMVKCPYCNCFQVKTSALYSEDYGYIGYATCENCGASACTGSDYPYRGTPDYHGETRYQAKKNALDLFVRGHIKGEDLDGFICKPRNPQDYEVSDDNN